MSKNPLTPLFHAAWIWTAVGLLGGLAYREVTKAHDFTGRTQLAFVHTHALALGMIGMLLALVLAAVLVDARSGAFRAFFWIYNTGLAVTVAMLAVHGYRQVLGEPGSPAIAGIAGMGHFGLSVGLVCLFVALRNALRADPAQTDTADPAHTGTVR